MISSHDSTWPNYKMVIQKDKTIFVQNDAESGPLLQKVVA